MVDYYQEVRFGIAYSKEDKVTLPIMISPSSYGVYKDFIQFIKDVRTGVLEPRILPDRDSSGWDLLSEEYEDFPEFAGAVLKEFPENVTLLHLAKHVSEIPKEPRIKVNGWVPIHYYKEIPTNEFMSLLVNYLL